MKEKVSSILNRHNEPLFLWPLSKNTNIRYHHRNNKRELADIHHRNASNFKREEINNYLNATDPNSFK